MTAWGLLAMILAIAGATSTLPRGRAMLSVNFMLLFFATASKPTIASFPKASSVYTAAIEETPCATSCSAARWASAR